MESKHIKALLVEDNPRDVGLIREMLTETRISNFDLECADRLSTGVECLVEGRIDVVLLDLNLPDSWGLETVVRMREHSPSVPIVVLTGTFDETLGIEAVHAGAQDYLLKDKLDSNLLERSMLYAVERQRLLLEVRSLTIVDELTGLHNRRGFLALAGQQLKIADRAKMPMLLVFADLDRMKWINDTFGHAEGDVALKETANVLRKTFRTSDIIARIGGDEFVVLAIETHEDGSDSISARLQRHLSTCNAERKRPYELSLSTGTAGYDPASPCSLDELLSRADRSMYEEKSGKPRGR